MAVQLNRSQSARIYTPRGYKPLSLGNAFIPSVAAAAYPTGTTINVPTGAVDVSTPLIGINFILKGRASVGTAPISALTPEGLLNLLNRVDIFGQHKILQSDTHPFTLDGATWAGILAQYKRRGFRVTISKAAGALTLDGIPGTPYPASGFDGTANTFDFEIELPVYFYPLGVDDEFKPGFMFRSEEWGDSLQMTITPGGQPSASANAGMLGTSGATTTVAFTGFQSVSGTPTLDIYGIPNIQGAATGLPALTVPGILSRTTSPRTSQVQSSGADVQIYQMQKRKTARLYIKAGLSTNSPVFTTLSDAIVSKLGLQVGTDKYPRNKVDWLNWKSNNSNEEGWVPTDPVTGYAVMEFLAAGSPYGSYAGDNVDAGTTFYVIGDPAGTANALVLVVQEQVLREPEGELYQF